MLADELAGAGLSAAAGGRDVVLNSRFDLHWTLWALFVERHHIVQYAGRELSIPTAVQLGKKRKAAHWSSSLVIGCATPVLLFGSERGWRASGGAASTAPTHSVIFVGIGRFVAQLAADSSAFRPSVSCNTQA